MPVSNSGGKIEDLLFGNSWKAVITILVLGTLGGTGISVLNPSNPTALRDELARVEAHQHDVIERATLETDKKLLEQREQIAKEVREEIRNLRNSIMQQQSVVHEGMQKSIEAYAREYTQESLRTYAPPKAEVLRRLDACERSQNRNNGK